MVWYCWIRGIGSGRRCRRDRGALDSSLIDGLGTVSAEVGDYFVGVVETIGFSGLHNV